MCQEVCTTCVRFSQVRGPWFVAATEAPPLLSRQRVSCPPLRLFRVRVTPFAAHRARLTLTCALRVVTSLCRARYLLPLVGWLLFLGYLGFLLSLLQRLLPQRGAGHGRLGLRQGDGGLVVGVVGGAGVQEQGFFSAGVGWSEEHLQTESKMWGKLEQQNVTKYKNKTQLAAFLELAERENVLQHSLIKRRCPEAGACSKQSNNIHVSVLYINSSPVSASNTE